MAWEWKSRKDLIWVLDSSHSGGREREEEGRKGKEKHELKYKSKKTPVTSGQEGGMPRRGGTWLRRSKNTGLKGMDFVQKANESFWPRE